MTWPGDEGELLAGNLGGAVRVGATVRRCVGPWTPAVHALLNHLAGRVPHIPEVLGFDELGREVLSYLPGRVLDTDTELLTVGQLVSMVRWTRVFHEAVADFAHPGPWRYPRLPGPTLIGHNDIAPYNVCFDGEELVGVFDWWPRRPAIRAWPTCWPTVKPNRTAPPWPACSTASPRSAGA